MVGAIKMAAEFVKKENKQIQKMKTFKKCFIAN